MRPREKDQIGQKAEKLGFKAGSSNFRAVFFLQHSTKLSALNTEDKEKMNLQPLTHST